jgi:hypothetical protein
LFAPQRDLYANCIKGVIERVSPASGTALCAKLTSPSLCTARTLLEAMQDPEPQMRQHATSTVACLLKRFGAKMDVPVLEQVRSFPRPRSATPARVFVRALFFPSRCVCVFSPRAAARRALAPPASRPPLSFRRQYRDQAIATLESAAAGSPIATECTNVVANFCAVANSGAVCNVVSTMMRLMRSSSSSADAAIMCVSQIAKEAGNKAGERLDELLDLLQGELTTGRDDSSDEKNERRANCAFSFRFICFFFCLFLFCSFLDPVRPGVLSAPRDSSRRSPA